VAVASTIALDLLLAFALLFSAQIAAGWGELAGIRPGRDKSGLGGFAALFVLFLGRWLVLAGALLAVAHVGEGRWLLAAHAGLGGASVLLFQHGLARVQGDRTLPNVLAVLGGVVLPAPACTFALQRANAAWLGDGDATLAATGAAVVALHFACCYTRRRDLLRSR
jgi:hypothetical protein